MSTQVNQRAIPSTMPPHLAEKVSKVQKAYERDTSAQAAPPEEPDTDDGALLESKEEVQAQEQFAESEADGGTWGPHVTEPTEVKRSGPVELDPIDYDEPPPISPDLQSKEAELAKYREELQRIQEENQAKEAELAKLKEIAAKYEEQERVKAMALTPEEVEMLGGENALKVYQKFIAPLQQEIAALKSEREVIKRQAIEEFQQKVAREAAASREEQFAQFVTSVVPDYNKMIKHPKFPEFLAQYKLSVHAPLKEVIAQRDMSDEAKNLLFGVRKAFGQYVNGKQVSADAFLGPVVGKTTTDSKPEPKKPISENPDEYAKVARQMARETDPEKKKALLRKLGMRVH